MLHLINTTSHQQEKSQWQPYGVTFANDGVPLVDPIDPARQLHPQVMNAWRKTLATADKERANGNRVQGVMLGGYAPLCLGVAEQARNFRMDTWVSVMQPAPPSAGMKRNFVPAGARWIAPPPFAIDQSKPPVFAPRALLQISNRNLDPTRQALLESVPGGLPVIDSKIILPPPMEDKNASQWLFEQAQETIEQALQQGAGILLDGVPMELILHLWRVAKYNGASIFYTKTEPAPPPMFATVVAIEKSIY